MTAKIVLTYHGHKFAGEGHNCGTSQEGIFPIDWLLSRVSSRQLARKLQFPKKHIDTMYIHCGLWNVPNQQHFKAVKLKLISEYNLWVWLSLTGSEWNVFWVARQKYHLFFFFLKYSRKSRGQYQTHSGKTSSQIF